MRLDGLKSCDFVEDIRIHACRDEKIYKKIILLMRSVVGQH
jgi:hypothetical protein